MGGRSCRQYGVADSTGWPTVRGGRQYGVADSTGWPIWGRASHQDPSTTFVGSSLWAAAPEAPLARDARGALLRGNFRAAGCSLCHTGPLEGRRHRRRFVLGGGAALASAGLPEAARSLEVVLAHRPEQGHLVLRLPGARAGAEARRGEPAEHGRPEAEARHGRADRLRVPGVDGGEDGGGEGAPAHPPRHGRQGLC